MKLPLVTLTSYNMGDVTEEDYDLWAAYVVKHIGEKAGFPVRVNQAHFTGSSQFKDTVEDATDEQEEAIVEALRAMWDEAAWGSEAST